MCWYIGELYCHQRLVRRRVDFFGSFYSVLSQVGYPVLTLAGDGSTSQTRFLAMAREEGAAATAAAEGGGKTTWSIPAKVVWELSLIHI